MKLISHFYQSSFVMLVYFVAVFLKITESECKFISAVEVTLNMLFVLDRTVHRRSSNEE